MALTILNYKKMIVGHVTVLNNYKRKHPKLIDANAVPGHHDRQYIKVSSRNALMAGSIGTQKQSAQSHQYGEKCYENL